MSDEKWLNISNKIYLTNGNGYYENADNYPIQRVVQSLQTNISKVESNTSICTFNIARVLEIMLCSYSKLVQYATSEDSFARDIAQLRLQSLKHEREAIKQEILDELKDALLPEPDEGSVV